MRFQLISIIAVALLLFGFAGTASANDTGFASIHAQVRVGSKICVSGHTHTGSGLASRTQKEALHSAIADWSGFTAWEYGTDWAKFRLAVGKTKSCSGTAGAISCTVVASPCKYLKRRRYAKRYRRKKN